MFSSKSSDGTKTSRFHSREFNPPLTIGLEPTTCRLRTEEDTGLSATGHFHVSRVSREPGAVQGISPSFVGVIAHPPRRSPILSQPFQRRTADRDGDVIQAALLKNG
jgi:hypothetical protein